MPRGLHDSDAAVILQECATERGAGSPEVGYSLLVSTWVLQIFCGSDMNSAQDLCRRPKTDAPQGFDLEIRMRQGCCRDRVLRYSCWAHVHRPTSSSMDSTTG